MRRLEALGLVGWILVVGSCSDRAVRFAAWKMVPFKPGDVLMSIWGTGGPSGGEQLIWGASGHVFAVGRLSTIVHFVKP